MKQLDLFEPVPSYLVGVRVKGGEIQQYTIEALSHAQAIEFVADALKADKIAVECALARKL